MRFFLGVHHPSDAGRVSRAFVSVNRIANRKSPFPVQEWIMDSGAFSTVNKFGGYPETPVVYAEQIRRWSNNGKLLAAVSQDFMCEPFVLAKTGGTIADHQQWTIERYDALLACDTGGVYVMPVLQGYAPADYVDHIRQYGARLKPGMWVGVGSICKRNANANTIEDVLLAINAERPDLHLHGFGIKITALGSQLVRDLLESADSMAWSFAARMAGRNGNDIGEGIRYARRVETMPAQHSMLRDLVA